MCTLIERVDLSAAVSKARRASPRAKRWVTVPAETAFKAPSGLDAEVAALAEPLACSGV